MKMIGFIALVLLIIGGLNWGLIAVADFNFVTAVFGTTVFTKVVYGLVGLAAVFKLFCFFDWCKCE